MAIRNRFSVRSVAVGLFRACIIGAAVEIYKEEQVESKKSATIECRWDAARAISDGGKSVKIGKVAVCWNAGLSTI